MMKICVSLFLLLICCSIPAFASPADDCLNQIAQAIETGDSSQFERLVDLGPIINSSLDAWLAEMQKPENAAQLPPMLAMMLTQANTQAGQAIKSMLGSAARTFVLNGISSGAFAGKKLPASESQNLLSPLFANASIGRKEIRPMGEAMQDDGEWLLPFNVHDYGNDNDYPVIGRFSPGNTGVKLTAIENLEQIFGQIQKEILSD